MSKPIIICLLALSLCVTASAQSRRAKSRVSPNQHISLVGTTWKIYTTDNGLMEWGTYTFLAGGKIAQDEKAKWELVGNKLTITEQYGGIELIVRGNLMTGGGQLGMNPRPFRMRGEKVGDNRPQPEPAALSQPSVQKLSDNNYSLSLPPSLQAAVNAYIGRNRGIRLASFRDSNGGEDLKKYMDSGEIRYPFACWGDLNRDGFLDVALVFVSNKAINSWDWHEWHIVAFHGDSSGSYKAVPVTKEQSGCFDALLYHKDENWVEFSCFGVAAGSFRWNGSRYVVKPKTGD